jgi:hypothetical protein
MSEGISYGSMLTGLAALTGAGLYMLDGTGAVQVDEAVAGASLLVVIGTAGLLRSAHRLLSRRSRG